MPCPHLWHLYSGMILQYDLWVRINSMGNTAPLHQNSCQGWPVSDSISAAPLWVFWKLKADQYITVALVSSIHTTTVGEPYKLVAGVVHPGNI